MEPCQKMEKDGLISFVREEEKRKIYQITDLGRKVLDIELKRIERLYRNSLEERWWKKKVVYRIATIADYDREALYLRKMHAEGWKLKEVTYSNLVVAVKYTFEKCQPEQVSYQLDFYPMKKSESLLFTII